MEERYTETEIGQQAEKPMIYGSNAVKTLYINGVLNNFVTRMDLDLSCYPALNLNIP
jgi:hypothetical protein